jgi:hypothetical protein
MREKYSDANIRKEFNIYTNMAKRHVEEKQKDPNYKPSKFELLLSQTGVPSERRLVRPHVRNIAKHLGDPGVVKNIDDFNDEPYIIKDGTQRSYNLHEYALEELHWYDDFVDEDTGISYPNLGILYFERGNDKLKILAVVEQSGDVLDYYKLDEGRVNGDLIQKAFRDKNEVVVIASDARGKRKSKSKKSKKSKAKKTKNPNVRN